MIGGQIVPAAVVGLTEQLVAVIRAGFLRGIGKAVVSVIIFVALRPAGRCEDRSVFRRSRVTRSGLADKNGLIPRGQLRTVQDHIIRVDPAERRSAWTGGETESGAWPESNGLLI